MAIIALFANDCSSDPDFHLCQEMTAPAANAGGGGRGVGMGQCDRISLCVIRTGWRDMPGRPFRQNEILFLYFRPLFSREQSAYLYWNMNKHSCRVPLHCMSMLMFRMPCNGCKLYGHSSLVRLLFFFFFFIKGWLIYDGFGFQSDFELKKCFLEIV